MIFVITKGNMVCKIMKFKRLIRSSIFVIKKGELLRKILYKVDKMIFVITKGNI